MLANVGLQCGNLSNTFYHWGSKERLAVIKDHHLVFVVTSNRFMCIMKYQFLELTYNAALLVINLSSFKRDACWDGNHADRLCYRTVRYCIYLMCRYCMYVCR